LQKTKNSWIKNPINIRIIANDAFRDEEYAVPRKVLEDAGAFVTVASSSLDVAAGMPGMKVKPEILIGNVIAGDRDGIVFVGGGGAKEYFDGPSAHALARSFFEHGKLTSAVCIDPATLANAGVLKDRRATSFPSSEQALRSRGAAVTGEDVSVDGNNVAGVGPEAARKFGKPLVNVPGAR
jgi:protease I